jgi:glycosyltransferase involved in cell wall biosynthesis
MEQWALIVAPHWEAGGSNHIFEAQIEYYHRRGWKAAIVLVPHYRHSKAITSPETSSFPADFLAALDNSHHLGRVLRFHFSKRVLANNPSGAVHRAFMLKADQLDHSAYEFLNSKSIGEICVNFFEHTDLALRVRDQLQKPSTPVVVHTHDVMAKHPVVSRRGKKEEVGELERLMLAKADRLVHVSDADATYFRNCVHLPQTTSYITLSPRLERKISSFVHRPRPRTVLYVGSWNIANPSGMDLFFRQILPLLPRDIEFYFAGDICWYIRDNLKVESSYPNVHLMYRVEDVFRLYQRSSLVILPAVLGTGGSVKFVEALAMGIPMVLSPAAARGAPIEVVESVSSVTAADPVAFAEMIEDAVGGILPVPDFRRLYETWFSNNAWYARMDNASGMEQIGRSHQVR